MGYAEENTFSAKVKRNLHRFADFSCSATWWVVYWGMSNCEPQIYVVYVQNGAMGGIPVRAYLSLSDAMALVNQYNNRPDRREGDAEYRIWSIGIDF